MDLITLLILILSAWRFTSLLVNEAGPFDVFERLRYLVGVRTNEYGITYAGNVVGDALTCVWCTSVWVGIGLVILFVYFPAPVTLVCLPFAVSAGAILVNELTGDA